MSTLKVNKIENTATTDGGVEIDNTGHVQIDGVQMPTAGPLSNRNLIINGAMQVAQRGTTFTSVASGSYTLDRWAFANGSSGVFDVAQSSTAPAGFANSLKVDCTTAVTTPDATHECFIRQYVEAQNLQHLQYGSSEAQSVELSFWVRSNKTGSFGVHFYSQDGDRRYSTTYSISSANTWEHKSVTISGDTAGTINDDNGRGFEIRFYLLAGSDRAGTPANTWGTDADNRTTDMNLGDSTDNEWLITGVQLEVGEKATPFEHRSFGDELARCQRYFYQIDSGAAEDPICMGMAITSHTCSALIYFPVTMRIAPSSMTSTGTAGDYNLRDGANGSGAATAAPSLGDVTEYAAQFGIVRQDGLTAGNAVHVRFNDADGFLGFSAEL